MEPYDPNNRQHRRELAERIVADLDRLRFTRDHARAGEAVYTRIPEPNVTVLVYTSIIGGEVRSVGADAIRVATIYTGGEKPRPLGRETTIHRRGTIDSIAGRLVERARHALEVDMPRCHRCNAPTFKSRSDNDVCAAICWERHLTPVVSPARSSEPAQAHRDIKPDKLRERPLTLIVNRRSPRAPMAVDW